jgi:RNA polymerase sigma-70 factor (ECF subfamily)
MIDKVKSNDEQAFELLFRKYYVHLCGFANKFISDTAEAEEIVQEVFLNIWRKRDQLKLNAEITPYLFRSVQNLCFNFVEHKKVVDSYYAVITQVYQNSPEEFNTYDPVLYAELQQKIDEAVDSLPAECRKIFQMSRLERLKYTEIAERLGISMKTVETQMSRALTKLRAELKDFLTIVIICILSNN